MKEPKPTKIVKVTFIYKEYGKGTRSLKFDRDKAKEIVKWLRREYLEELIMRDN